MSPNKHQTKKPGGKQVSASETAWQVEAGTISESKLKARKIDRDLEEGNFFSCDKSDGKPVHVDIQKTVAEGNNTTLELLPKTLE